MKNQKNRIILISLLVILLASCGEQKEALPPVYSIGDAVKDSLFNHFVWGLQTGNPRPQDAKQEGAVDTIFDQDYICVSRFYSGKDVLNDQLLLDPTTSFFPGLWLLPNSHIDGSFGIMADDKDSLTITLDLAHNANGALSAKMPKVNFSSYQQALQEILKSHNGSFNAGKGSLTIRQIKSESQFYAATGLGVTLSNFDIGAYLNFQRKDIKSRFVLQFQQIYFSANIDIPSTPANWFGEKLPNPQNWGNISPTYISSISYGRSAFLFLESDKHERIVEAALNAVFNGKRDTIIGGIQLSSKEIINSSFKGGVILGGDASEGLKTLLNPSEFSDFIEEGANFSPNSPGVPLSFRLRHVSDNSIAQILYSYRYPLQTCERLRYRYDILLEHLEIPKVSTRNLQIYGWITTWPSPYPDVESAEQADSLFWLFDIDKNQAISMNKGIYHLNREQIIRFPKPKEGEIFDPEEEYITLRVKLKDYDFLSGDEEYETVEKVIPLSDIIIGEPIYVTTSGKEGTIIAKFLITPK